MEILIHPTDLLRCSLAARGALLVGERARIPFPDPEVLLRIPGPARQAIEERLDWISGFVDKGWCVFDAGPGGAWEASVRSAMGLVQNSILGVTLRGGADPNDALAISDRMARGLATDPVGALAQLAIDNLLDQSACANGALVARELSQSRIGRIERTMTQILGRYQVLVPRAEDADQILEVRTELGDSISRVNAALDALLEEDELGLVGDAFGELCSRTRDLGHDGMVQGIVSIARIPVNISVRAAEAALVATTGSSRKASTQLDMAVAGESLCLLFKPLGGKF